MRSSSAGDTGSFVGLTGPDGVRHQPGLDGLRGLAVAAVVVFHTGLGWLPGGYLGVSLFFTISGTVIGTVILDEIDRRGGFSPRRFWARRGRRLLPAAWLVLAVVAVVRVTSTVFAATSAGDIAAAWLQVANWQLLATDHAYADLFAGPSAVLHFWSLAIEEQFYVVVGVAAIVLGRTGGRSARLLGVVAGGLAVVSFALPFVVTMSVERVYYGTDARAGELLLGLVLAAVIASARRHGAIARARHPLAGVGAAALGLTVAMWVLLDVGTDGLRRGLLPLTALASSAVILAAMLPGPVRTVATLRPVRWLGGISYGLYLIHWPVLVALDHVAPDPGVAPIALAVAISVGLAWLCAIVVELPVRRHLVAPRRLAIGTAALAVALVAALVVPAPTTTAQALVDRLSVATLPATPPTATAPDAGAPLADAPTPTATAATATPRLELVGDSIGLSLALTLGFAGDAARFTLGDSEIELGCGVAADPGTRCADLVDRMVAAIPTRRIDAVLVVSCQWELLTPTPPDELRARYRDVAVRLDAAGARVLWLRCPRLSEAVHPPDLPADLAASRDPARMAVLDGVVDELAAEGLVEPVDLASWFEPRVDDAVLRPDGAHVEWRRDTGVAAELTSLLNAALAR